ncbi:MAG: AI-2E family transporter [bacterium]
MDFAKLRTILFFGLLAFITIAFFYVIKPFLLPVFWAAVIASIFYPIHLKLARHLKMKNLSAMITLLFVFIIIVIPLTLLSSLLIKESLDLYAAIDNNKGQIIGNVQETVNWVKNNTLTKNLNIDEEMLVSKFSDVTKTITSFIFIRLKNLTQNSLLFVAMFIIMFYTLFYFLRDGQDMLKKLMYLSPLGDKNERMLYNKFTSTARAAIKGTLIIGVVQGFLGSIIFIIAGVEGALVWGIIMIVAAAVPGVGSSIVWLPAGIIMLIAGNVWQGMVIIIFGATVIGTIDNLLRPLLIGKDTNMHPLLILFSTLGGIVMFGISGFIIGPIVAALLLSMWEMYAHHYRKELSNN